MALSPTPFGEEGPLDTSTPSLVEILGVWFTHPLPPPIPLVGSATNEDDVNLSTATVVGTLRRIQPIVDKVRLHWWTGGRCNLMEDLSIHLEDLHSGGECGWEVGLVKKGLQHSPSPSPPLLDECRRFFLNPAFFGLRIFVVFRSHSDNLCGLFTLMRLLITPIIWGGGRIPPTILLL